MFLAYINGTMAGMIYANESLRTEQALNIFPLLLLKEPFFPMKVTLEFSLMNNFLERALL